MDDLAQALCAGALLLLAGLGMAAVLVQSRGEARNQCLSTCIGADAGVERCFEYCDRTTDDKR